MNILPQKFLKNISLAIFCAIFCLTYFASLQTSYASDCDDETLCGIGRIRSCTAGGSPSSLVFDPTMNGADVMFDLSNPICLTVITTSYAAVKTAIAGMCYTCGLNQYPDPTPSPIRDSALIISGAIKAASSNSANCGAAVEVATYSMAVALAELGIIYGVAKNVFDKSSLCGADWLTYEPTKYNISRPSYKSDVESAVKAGTAGDLSNPKSKYSEWYYDGIATEDAPATGDYCEDPTGSNTKSNGHYPRQVYYLRGTQSGNYNCSKYDINLFPESTSWDNSKVNDYKKAYSCCLNRSKNYACIKYETAGASAANNNALDPLQNNNGVFCKSGSNCTIKGITFSAAPLTSGDSRLICVQSYSLCPYNFTVGKGGTQYCDYFQDGIKGSNGRYTYITPDDITKATATDPVTGAITGTQDCNTKSEIRNADCTYNTKAGQCKNYCQYLTHCVVVGASNYQYQSSLNSPYFSNACMNFVGDSRNITSFNSGIVLGSQRHFSAPIAQCVKETLENVFYNKAGHSKCFDASEYPLSNGTCVSGNYAHNGSFSFQKGNPVKAVSFFSNLQNTLQDTVKMILTLSIMFFGIKILVAHNASEIKKSDLIMYCIKIGLVMYFATGDAWQNFFFDGVYNTSTTLSEIVFHVESTMPDNKKDGCQFDAATLGPINQYPNGKNYLSMWDTLDCKIARYLGFGPEASTANIAGMIFAGLFVGPYGIYFVLGLMFFGFTFLAMTIRALHIFLSSAISIIIMVYISPVIIPMVMFPKTAGMFKSWLTNLISFCIQPMILFAYIAIFIVVFDSTMIGSATFSGTAPSKSISCRDVCENSNGNEVTGDTNCSQAGHAWVGGTCVDTGGNAVLDDPTCTGVGHTLQGATCKDASGNNVGGDPNCTDPSHTLVSPLTNSIACLVDFQDYNKINTLEIIGISLPSIVDLFTDHVKEKILTIMKAAFVMYVLCSFVDQIPGITEALIGGTPLPSGKLSNAMAMMKSVSGVAEDIRGRTTRGLAKYGKDSYKTASDVNEKANSGKEEEGKANSSSAKTADNPESSEGVGNRSDDGNQNAGNKEE